MRNRVEGGSANCLLNPKNAIASFRGSAKEWMVSHPHVYAVYKSSKFRMATSPIRDLPDFVIIGAMKSATTSLYDFVVRHPDIATASKKEVQFFTKWYRFGHMWYRSNFPTRISKYRHRMTAGRRLISGEATPYYLFHPLVPGRMRRIMPDVKLIVILRNPVDRAYSHYHMTRIRNREHLPFEEALESEGDRTGGHRERIMQDSGFDDRAFQTTSYLAMGVYVDQLVHWFRYYDRRQFLILSAEDLRRDPQGTLDQTFGFLGVSRPPPTSRHAT